MISDRQLAANRHNAQHSTGARTAAGKARSSLNNLRHGLTGQINILPDEDREAHHRFCAGLIDSLKPESPMEHQFAQSIAEDYWRLNRARAVDNNMFALGRQGETEDLQIALADARTFQFQANQFQLLSIYEQRINRNLQRNLKQLRELQAERLQQQDRALAEAQFLAQQVAQQSIVNGLPGKPAENGFVFANAEIDRPSQPECKHLAALTIRQPPPGREAFSARSA